MISIKYVDFEESPSATTANTLNEAISIAQKAHADYSENHPDDRFSVNVYETYPNNCQKLQYTTKLSVESSWETSDFLCQYGELIAAHGMTERFEKSEHLFGMLHPLPNNNYPDLARKFMLPSVEEFPQFHEKELQYVDSYDCGNAYTYGDAGYWRYLVNILVSLGYAVENIVVNEPDIELSDCKLPDGYAWHIILNDHHLYAVSNNSIEMIE